MKHFYLKILSFVIILILGIIVSNIVYGKYIFETDSFLIVEANLDRTPPQAEVSYSITDVTNGNVIVSINTNEKIQEIEGWELSTNRQTLVKTFNDNTVQNIDIYDLAGNKTTTNISISNIDKVRPTVECVSVTNSNSAYPEYANSGAIIDLKIKISDNVQIKNVDLNKISVKLDSNNSNVTKEWSLQNENTKEKVYNLRLKNISGNGKLIISFEEGIVTDVANNINLKLDKNTNITIDNISPTISYSQLVVSNGKVKAMLNANEKIRVLNGWNISSDKKQLNKEFVSNVSYELTVTDLAGNKTVTNVNVTGATYISLIYASHNSNIGWTYGHGNYDIAGKTSVLTNTLYKTEALAFNISGNIEKDFVKARTYINTHWGAGSRAVCKDSGLIYSYGYNPTSTGWKSMNSNDLVTIDGKKYFQFGGAGINAYLNTDINGNGVIDAVTANQFNYGICGIILSLKDYTDYSIVYQIYVSERGWLSAVSNGMETMYSTTKPMSAFRVALIPSSERQYQIDTWNKDYGKTIQ